MKISLTQNKFAIIDNEDWDKIKDYSWCISTDNNIVAYIKGSGRKNRKLILLHRLIMNAKQGQEIDHINRNRLDNRKNNLRFCNRSQNNMNAKKRKGTLSKYKGVTWSKRDKKWKSYIGLNGKFINLGSYDNEKIAALIYNEKAQQLFGEFARVNKSGGKNGCL